MNEHSARPEAAGSAAAQHRVTGGAQASARSPDPLAAFRPSILVVEDDVALASSLVRVIQYFGGEATVVGTVRAAKSLLANVDAWSALVLDVSLGDSSGLDLLSHARTAHSTLPALILTGRLDRNVANAAFDLQAAYLVKPVTTTQLEEFLRRAVNQLAGRPPPMPVDDTLPDDLRRLTGDVLSAAAEAGIAHAEYAYRMALLARAASGRSHRGSSAVDLCAKAARTSRSTLQQYISVTARWTPLQIRNLLGVRDCRGHVVTIHHLLTIVRAPARARSELVRVITDGADLRQIRTVVCSHKTGGCLRDNPGTT